jgi:hypothetical protein
MDKLVCEATPEGKLYSDEEVKNINFMNIQKDVKVHPMCGGVAMDAYGTFSYTREGYYDNL